MQNPKFMFHLGAESQNILYNLVNKNIPARALPHFEQGGAAAQQSRADAIQDIQNWSLGSAFLPGPLQPLMGLTRVKENTAALSHRWCLAG